MLIIKKFDKLSLRKNLGSFYTADGNVSQDSLLEGKLAISIKISVCISYYPATPFIYTLPITGMYIKSTVKEVQLQL